MKVGSLVVCIRSSKGEPFHKATIKGKVYTIRAIQIVPSLNGVGLLFEEVVNEIHPLCKYEYDYLPSRFREIDCPTSIDIEEIIELEQV